MAHFDGLTDEQKQTFEQRIRGLGIDPAEVPETLSTADHPGGLRLCADADIAGVKPILIELGSIQEMKDRGGVPDADYHSGRAFDLHIDYPDPPPAEARSLTASLAADRCKLEAELGARQADDAPAT